MDHSQRPPLGPSRSPFLREGRSDGSENSQAPGHPDRNAPVAGNPPGADRQPRHSDGFTVIPPNESRRSKMKLMAQKEEEELQRLKEAQRVTSVHVNPERLGGHVTLAEAREKQLQGQRCSKLQKKLRQQDLDNRRKQEEEEKNQRMKAEQREKAERLEERSHREEQRRREQLRHNHLRAMETFLQSLERRTLGPLASSGTACTSSRVSLREAVESKPRKTQEESVREAQLEQKRVNAAFLDKLEGRGSGSEREPPSLASDFRHQPSTASAQAAVTHLKPDAEQSCSSRTEKADPDPDYNWALMKLMASFPDFCKVFLEDILNQCSGSYQQAYTLLIGSLS